MGASIRGSPFASGDHMKSLSVDIETYSDRDLTKCGVYKYAESPEFAVLLFAYSIDGGDVRVVDLASGEKLQPEIIDALHDDAVLKHAYNASFERVCLSRFLGIDGYLNPSSWRCTMVHALSLGLPASLMEVGAVLGLKKQKIAEGKDLIRFFCVPATQKLLCGLRHIPAEAPSKWARFKEYNRRDVETEMEIQARLAKFPISEDVWSQYAQDQEINDRGVRIDMKMVENAIKMDTISHDKIEARMREITGVANPNSAQQLRTWLEEYGVMADSLDKNAVAGMLKDVNADLRDMLKLRLQLAMSSVKKYQAMKTAVCDDSRAHGMFQFFGASRTGRWAGRIIQMQNLRRNDLPDLADARELVRMGDYDAIELLYGNVPDTLSQLVRTAFVPNEGMKFIVADFSAIEARVIAWLAGEKWRSEVFAKGKDIYCASASQMFGVPVEKHGINGHLRQKGKIAELALGYGGGVGALKAMGALSMGLSEDELPDLVKAWRDANPAIVSFWWDMDAAAKKVVLGKREAVSRGILFCKEGGTLFITLPSGRRLAYPRPRMGENRFGGESITFEGVGVSKKWERIETYGPKLVENIVQATSRDLLAYAMQNLRDRRIVMHIHDEVVIEAKLKVSLEEICNVMSQTPPWAEGLLLRADGYETEFYKKD